jgi:hypothetical protein
MIYSHVEIAVHAVTLLQSLIFHISVWRIYKKIGESGGSRRRAVEARIKQPSIFFIFSYFFIRVKLESVSSVEGRETRRRLDFFLYLIIRENSKSA